MDSLHIWHKWSLAWEDVSHVTTFDLDLYFQGHSTLTSKIVSARPSVPPAVSALWHHTMEMLWERLQWILPLYIKPISFQSKALVVCSVTAAVFIDFCLKKITMFSQHIGKKNKWISEFYRTNPQKLKCLSTFYVNYFLRYYLMMQHQPIVKIVNGTQGWAHRPYQPLSASYHCCLYKQRRLDERQPPQTSWPVPICT